ncbi:VanZ family protein [Candidatus Palauibacter sp.]|uniref:VanZ family protein n=1 Tax=Candidatus Palauibacter sp. TaxID=3101350 RepID=UPI003B5B79DC
MTKPFFSSDRERRLWTWALAAVVVIYSTLGLARTLADALRASGLLVFSSNLIAGGMLLIGVMIVVQGLKKRSGGVEIGFAIGVAAICLLGFARMGAPEERSHLIEYAVLALIVHEALTERTAQGLRVPVPAVLAVLGTTLVGVFDECIQYFLPSRTFDLLDIVFDFMAALGAVASCVVLRWTRRWIGRFLRER